MRRIIQLLALFAIAAACLPVAPAAALPFEVTSVADDGSAGTLRWAIEEANELGGADTIPIATTGTISLLSALPTISDDVSITGPGAVLLEVRRDEAAVDFPVLVLSSGKSSVAGLTISNGRDDLGAGITNAAGSLTLTGVAVRENEAYVEGVEESVAEGGGIFSLGPLTLRESVVADNVVRATEGSTQAVAVGGGIIALGPLTVERSTISGNVAEAADGDFVVAQGGGVITGGEATTIALSTISRNSVSAREGGPMTLAAGGGLEIDKGTVTGSTFIGNSAESHGDAFGANLDAHDETVVRNTILAEPLGHTGNCHGLELFSGGFNLDEDGSCGFGAATDLAEVLAGLDPVLKSNGGPTPTHALLAGSAAIDRGNSFGSAIDQRGLPRPSDFATVGNAEGGDGGDIGAFELQVPVPSPVIVTSAPADTQPPNTRIVKGPPRVTFKRVARFWFNSTEAQSSFQCKIDKRRWQRCLSPYKRKVGAGRKHVFKVRAIDRFGNVDPTPARFGWRVKAIGG